MFRRIITAARNDVQHYYYPGSGFWAWLDWAGHGALILVACLWLGGAAGFAVGFLLALLMQPEALLLWALYLTYLGAGIGFIGFIGLLYWGFRSASTA